MRWFLSQTIVPIFKKMRILGWVRFRILRYAYRIFWWNSPRNGEWDFVLGWMRPLRFWQKPVYVLDVGSTESLLIYELLHRGYEVTGIDQRPYQEPNKHTEIQDVLEPFELNPNYDDFGKYKGGFDYILAISSLEHVGLGAYQDTLYISGDRKALENLYSNLKEDGYFIMTVPNKHLGTETGRGYSYKDFCKLIEGLYNIIYFEERSNQICAVMVKS